MADTNDFDSMDNIGTEEQQDTAKETTGALASFVLLSEAEIDLNLLAEDLEKDWGITVSEEGFNEEKDALVADVDGMYVAVSLVDAPVPNEEAVVNAGTNFFWPDAVETAKAHKAQVIIAILKHDEPLLNAAKLYVKVCASCLKQPKATAINTLGSVYEPKFYIDSAEHAFAGGVFPVSNLVFIGLYGSNDKVCGYTYGMDVFGKKNMEIIESERTSGEVYDFLYNIAAYVIESDITLQSGETIGFSENEKNAITESDSNVLGEPTLKIAF